MFVDKHRVDSYMTLRNHSYRVIFTLHQPSHSTLHFPNTIAHTPSPAHTRHPYASNPTTTLHIPPIISPTLTHNNSYSTFPHSTKPIYFLGCQTFRGTVYSTLISGDIKISFDGGLVWGTFQVHKGEPAIKVSGIS